MAGAGFLFTPHEAGDDTAKCFYCGIELSGWEPDDDPVYVQPKSSIASTDVTREEHRRRIAKRGTECPFFTAKITELPEKKKAIRKTTSKASLQTQKTTRTRPAKTLDPEPDSDDQEFNPGRSTRSRAAKATKTPARTPARSTAGARSRATSSAAETDEPSGSDVVEVTKPKAKGSKRKAKDETPVAEEGESEDIVNNLRKSTRAKKTGGVFEDIEADVNFEESRSRQALPRRSTRSRSKAPAGDSDSDVSVKSVRSTRSTRSAKTTRGATKTKGKAKAQPMVEGAEEDAATPVQTLKKGTRAVAPPKSTRARKLVAEESVESESSEIPPPPPPKLRKSTVKSRKKIIESESEEWQSAQEDVTPTPRPSTTKKARGRPLKATKTPKAPQKPPPVPPSPTPTSDVSLVSRSYMSESELRIPVAEDSSEVREPSTKPPVQPFLAKPSNQSHALTKSRVQPQASARLPSIGSRENADDKKTIIIDASDDEDDTRRFVPSKSMMYNSTSSNPSKVNGVSTSTSAKLTSTMTKKRESFVGVVLSSSPQVTHQFTKAHGKIAEKDMDVDEVTVLDQPTRSAETDHESPAAADKGKAKATVIPTKPKPPLTTSERREKTVIQSEASDSAMDVDDRDDYGVQDAQPIPELRQPSTPRRDPPRKLFRDDLNPFTTVPPQQDSNDTANPLSAFEAPYGKVPAEVIYALAEEEKEMTVEEWTKRELEIQLEMFREHGLRKIREFKERAAEVRRQIEAL